MTSYLALTVSPTPDRLQRVMDELGPDVTLCHVQAMREDCRRMLRWLGVPDPADRWAPTWAPVWDVQRIVEAASNRCGREVRCVRERWAAAFAGAIVSSPDCHVLFVPPGTDARAAHVLLHSLAHVLFGDPLAAHLPAPDPTPDPGAGRAVAVDDAADRETRADLFATMAAAWLACHRAGQQRLHPPEVHVGAPADRLFSLLLTQPRGAARATPPRSTGHARRAAH